MESHLQDFLRHYKTRVKSFTLKRIFQEVGFESSRCTKMIEPINAVAIGEYEKKSYHKRKAVIAVLDSNFRGNCTDVTSCIAF